MPSAVFETAAFGHSAISPSSIKYVFNMPQIDDLANQQGGNSHALATDIAILGSAHHGLHE